MHIHFSERINYLSPMYTTCILYSYIVGISNAAVTPAATTAKSPGAKIIIQDPYYLFSVFFLDSLCYMSPVIKSCITSQKKTQLYGQVKMDKNIFIYKKFKRVTSKGVHVLFFVGFWNDICLNNLKIDNLIKL